MPRSSKRRRRSRRVEETFSSRSRSRRHRSRHESSSSSGRLRRTTRLDPGYGRVRTGGLGGYTSNQFRAIPPTAYGRAGAAGAQGPAGPAGPPGKAVVPDEIKELTYAQVKTIEAKYKTELANFQEKMQKEVATMGAAATRMMESADQAKNTEQRVGILHTTVRDAVGRLESVVGEYKQLKDGMDLATRTEVDQMQRDMAALVGSEVNKRMTDLAQTAKFSKDFSAQVAAHLAAGDAAATFSASVASNLANRDDVIKTLAKGLQSIVAAEQLEAKAQVSMTDKPGSLKNVEAQYQQELLSKYVSKEELGTVKGHLVAELRNHVSKELQSLTKKREKETQALQTQLAAITGSLQKIQTVQDGSVDKKYLEAQLLAQQEVIAGELAKVQSVYEKQETSLQGLHSVTEHLRSRINDAFTDITTLDDNVTGLVSHVYAPTEQEALEMKDEPKDLTTRTNRIDATLSSQGRNLDSLATKVDEIDSIGEKLQKQAEILDAISKHLGLYEVATGQTPTVSGS